MTGENIGLLKMNVELANSLFKEHSAQVHCIDCSQGNNEMDNIEKDLKTLLCNKTTLSNAAKTFYVTFSYYLH